MNKKQYISVGAVSKIEKIFVKSRGSGVGNLNPLHPVRSPLPRTTNATGASWYVAQVLTQKEAYAALHLARQGFETFYPRFQRTRSHARKRDTVLFPLFPGYIFVKFDIKVDRWLAVNSTQGVIRLVGPRLSAPSAVSQELIDLLMSRCSDGVIVRLPEYIRTGERILITAGALAGQIATIEALDDRGRVSVLLSLLGTEHSVSVRADQLAPMAAT
ncbi:transcription termination/antitermination protein NusG [Sphingorhabdus sp. EL138]|uniref:transcription termination/antitermination protein NusG n=1 Tax=Sphingorhabdus sp. EL138 TaxID=2073156 RepID=UPI0025F20F5E|nr:transcriptional activator RfaH [Sphingorhabdus sp. EL138]